MSDAPSCRSIDLDSWPRRDAYELFRKMAFPYLSLTADVDVTDLKAYASRSSHAFTVGLVFALARGANAVPALRQRLRGEEVVEFEIVHPSITVSSSKGRFTFCQLPYDERFEEFAEPAAKRIEGARRSPGLWTEEDRDDFLFMTALPWIAFTGMIHPVPLNPPDSVPRIAWGQYRDMGGRWRMPLNIQAHHALVDGAHVGAFYERVDLELARFATR